MWNTDGKLTVPQTKQQTQFKIKAIDHKRPDGPAERECGFLLEVYLKNYKRSD